MNRFRTSIFIISVVLLSSNLAAAGEEPVRRPNVLFIMADDLFDGISPLGSALAQTPNLDRLAQRGVVFERAYCVVPACAPSRTSLFTGVAPTTSGIYFNNQPIARSTSWIRDAVDLPRHFKQAGYLTAGLGKLFHHRSDQDDKADSWSMGHFQGYSAAEDSRHNLKASHTVSLDSVWPGTWGWYGDDWDRDDPAKMQQDTVNSIRAAGLVSMRHDRPFFVAVGIFRPHSKWFVAQRYYDLYPEESIPLPEGWREDDLDDVPAPGRWLAQRNVTPDTHRTLTERKLWRAAIRAYLASITFADEQIGRVLDALESGPNAGNTIVVFCSDHGYHLGEKEHWNKFTLWERSARVPLIIALPSSAAHKPRRIQAPVSLLDLYPTLVDIAGVPAPAHRLDGISLRPILEGTTGVRGAPVITTHGRGNHAVRDERWRYIRYRTGDEELYDHSSDPHEWRNLAGDDRWRSVMDALATHLAGDQAENSPFQASREVEWLGRDIFGPQ